MLMVGLGFWLAYIVRFEMGFSWTFQPELAPLDFYQRLVILLVPAWVIVFGLFGLYDFKNLFRGMSEYSHVFNATTLAIMLVISFTFFDPNFVIARAWVMLSWLLVSVTVSMGRFFARRLVQYLRVKEHLLT
ncbi:MAG: sugar transferase, partial [Anaerolineae bacterium]